jgi:hypothetical protein
LLFWASVRNTLSWAAMTMQLIAHAALRSFTSASGNAIMASAEPRAEKALSVAPTAEAKLFSLMASSLPRPTNSTRAAAAPETPRSSKLVPALPVI